MALHEFGSILLDISIGLSLIWALLRLVLFMKYIKQNGSRNLTDSQKKKLKKIMLPISITALTTSLAAFVLIVISQ